MPRFPRPLVPTVECSVLAPVDGFPRLQPPMKVPKLLWFSHIGKRARDGMPNSRPCHCTVGRTSFHNPAQARCLHEQRHARVGSVVCTSVLRLVPRDHDMHSSVQRHAVRSMLGVRDRAVVLEESAHHDRVELDELAPTKTTNKSIKMTLRYVTKSLVSHVIVGCALWCAERTPNQSVLRSATADQNAFASPRFFPCIALVPL